MLMVPGPFMVATKIKGMVAAEVSDERSAYDSAVQQLCGLWLLWVLNLLVMDS